MPYQPTMPNYQPSQRRAGAGGVRLLMVALCGGLLLSTAAAAQQPSGAPAPGKPASRERRAKASADAEKKQETPASTEAPQSKAPVANPAAVLASEKSPGEKPAPEKDEAAKGSTETMEATEKTVEPSASAPSASLADEGAEIESLRVRAESEKDGAERGRLRRALAERLASAGRRAEAVDLLREMLREERFDPPFFYNTGNALARLGDSGSAIEAYRKAAGQRRGNYSRAQHNLGVVLMRLGRWEEAQEALNAALRLENFAYAEASYSLGRLYALRGEAGLAIKEWARTLKIKPDHADAAIALARALFEDGDPEEALAVLDAFNTRVARTGASAPREVAVARGEIVAARNVAMYDEKEQRGSSSEKSAMSSSGFARASGPGKSVSSGVRVRASKSLRPLNVDRETYTLLRRARTARESQRFDESVALYRRVIEGSGGYFPPANLELSFALASLGRDEEAVTSLQSVARKDGERYPIAFYHLGRYYEHLGRLEQAGEAFSRAAALLGDESPQFLLDVSRVREKEGKWPEALAATEDYVRATEHLGAVPDWARERLARLRQKATTTTTVEQK
jgi:tetratricopeptide (TPR) repeat protein